jgi:hypothetical protein
VASEASWSYPTSIINGREEDGMGFFTRDIGVHEIVIGY